KVTMDGFMADDARTWHDAYLSHIAQTHAPATGRVNQQVANAAETLACFGRTPHHHVEHLLFLEKAANLSTRKNGGRGATSIARRDAIALRRGEVDLNFQNWLLNREI